VSGLGHILEGAGISTVVIGLIPQQVRAMRPPRALLVPFDLGLPFGAPNQPELQATVLAAALGLLDRDVTPPLIEVLDVPVPEVIRDDGWACPVALPAPGREVTGADRVLEEARLLQPWFDRGRRERGHSGFGASGLDIDEVCRWLFGLLVDPTPEKAPVSVLSVADSFKLAAEDLKAFYLEAASAQPKPGSARALNDWFWDETAAGTLLKQLREALREHEDGAMRIYAAMTLVPEARFRPGHR
jgi:hypothetical protein